MNKNIKKFESINSKIEKLNKKQHIEILRIIAKDDKINISENKNGSFINMNELSNEIINKIIEYLNYIETKEMELLNIENKKNMIAETMNDNN
jgi:hypothetical protein